MKICSRCGQAKSTSEYFVKDKSSGRLHAQCKDCYRARRRETYADHYRKYGELYRQRARDYRDKVKNEYRTKIISILDGARCVKCGEPDIRTLEFDHIDPTLKSFNISQSIRLGKTWPEIELEI